VPRTAASPDILLAPGGKKAAPGQVVTVELLVQPTNFAQPIGRSSKSLAITQIRAWRSNRAPQARNADEFTSEAKAETRKLPPNVRKKDWLARGHHALPLVTLRR